MQCYHCQKGALYGRSHTHHRGVAGGRWKKRAVKTQRIFLPNLQRVEIIEENKTKRVHLCTKCLKRIKYDVRQGTHPFLMLANTATVAAEAPDASKQAKQD
jgi:ribosomal protein L28